MAPVLVYYSFQPFHNSRLEDFSAASAHDYRIKKPALVVGLPPPIFACVYIAFGSRKDKGDDDPSPDREKGASGSNEVPDSIHIAPDQ